MLVCGSGFDTENVEVRLNEVRGVVPGIIGPSMSGDQPVARMAGIESGSIGVTTPLAHC